MISIEREESLFWKAVELPIHERPAFLAQICSGNPALQESLESLLSQHETEDEFMETPALGASIKLEEQPGEQIGRYRLIQKIGEGGFGIVWEAEQLEPVPRRVALKILKLGQNCQEFVDRFENELRSLAIITHPHIATVFDAGKTSGGRPFISMELVEGKTIDQFCKEHNLTVDEKLRLFVKVCRSIHHAHLKGIIHRDLKPSNILVRLDEGTAIPKVIDFGIAKVAHSASEREPKSPDVVGTPSYMSREQFCQPNSVDVRSDVYSLGAVLYKLMTDRAPVDPSIFRDKSLSEIQQLVQAEIPRAPTQFGHPIKLRWLGQDELDCVISKAMANSPSSRYDSALEFARDIERYLEGQAVSAASQNPSYRFRKFAIQNWIGVTTTCLMVMVILIGSLFSSLGWIQAEKQRQLAEQQSLQAQTQKANAEEQKRIAEREAKEANLVSEFLKKMIANANPVRGRSSPKQQLDEVADSLDDLSEYPLVEAELRRVTGLNYTSRSNRNDAAFHLQRALEIREQVLGHSHSLTLRSRTDYAAALAKLGQYDEAERRVLDVIVAQSKRPLNNTTISAYKVLRRIRDTQRDFAAAYELSKKCYELSCRLHGELHFETLSRKIEWASVCINFRKKKKALELGIPAVHSLAKHFPEKKFPLANTQFRLVPILVAHGQLAEAESMIVAATKSFRNLFGEHDEHVIRCMNNYADILWRTGRQKKAEKIAREAYQIAFSLPEDHVVIRAASSRRLSVILTDSLPWQAAEYLRESIYFRRMYLGDKHPQVAGHLNELGDLLAVLDQFEDARDCYWESLQIWRIQQSTPHGLRKLTEKLTHLVMRTGEMSDGVSKRISDAFDADDERAALNLLDHWARNSSSKLLAVHNPKQH